MGSVSDNYQCPWCRRTNGGYAPDGVDYRICTQGPFSCLWHHWHDNDRTSETVVDLFDDGWALHYVFVKKFDVGWCTRVWQFCAGPPDPAPPPLEFETGSSTDVVQPHIDGSDIRELVQPHHPALQRWSIVLFDGSTVEEEVEIDWDSSTDVELDWD